MVLVVVVVLLLVQQPPLTWPAPSFVSLGLGERSLSLFVMLKLHLSILVLACLLLFHIICVFHTLTLEFRFQIRDSCWTALRSCLLFRSCSFFSWVFFANLLSLLMMEYDTLQWLSSFLPHHQPDEHCCIQQQYWPLWPHVPHLILIPPAPTILIYPSQIPATSSLYHYHYQEGDGSSPAKTSSYWFALSLWLTITHCYLLWYLSCNRFLKKLKKKERMEVNNYGNGKNSISDLESKDEQR